MGLVLEERQKKIDENLDIAEQLRKEAQVELDAYEKSVSEARDTARSSIAGSIKQASETSQVRHLETGEELAARVRDAEARIDATKQEAISGIQEAAAPIASLVAKKLIGESPASEEVHQAVAIAMKERSA